MISQTRFNCVKFDQPLSLIDLETITMQIIDNYQTALLFYCLNIFKALKGSSVKPVCALSINIYHIKLIIIKFIDVEGGWVGGAIGRPSEHP